MYVIQLVIYYHLNLNFILIVEDSKDKGRRTIFDDWDAASKHKVIIKVDVLYNGVYPTKYKVRIVYHI